jgi:hypothetical protein
LRSRRYSKKAAKPAGEKPLAKMPYAGTLYGPASGVKFLPGAAKHAAAAKKAAQEKKAAAKQITAKKAAAKKPAAKKLAAKKA